MSKDTWQEHITRLCVIDAFSSKSFFLLQCLSIAETALREKRKKTGMIYNDSLMENSAPHYCWFLDHDDSDN